MNGHERRKDHRINTTVHGDMGAEATVIRPDIVQDLSLGGAAFVADRTYEPGETLQLTLTLPDGNGGGETIEATCRVRQSAAQEGGHHRIGVEFIDFAADGQARLADYLEAVTAVL